MITCAGRSGDPVIVKEAKKRFELISGGEQNAVHPNLLEAVCSITILHGGKDEFEKGLEIYRFIFYYF